MKYCSRCKTEKPWTAFSKCATKANGHVSHCKACDRQKFINRGVPCKTCGEWSVGGRCKACYQIIVESRKAERLAYEPIKQLNRQVRETNQILYQLEGVLNEMQVV